MTLIQNDGDEFQQKLDFWRQRLEKRARITEIDEKFIEYVNCTVRLVRIELRIKSPMIHDNPCHGRWGRGSNYLGRGMLKYPLNA